MKQNDQIEFLFSIMFIPIERFFQSQNQSSLNGINIGIKNIIILAELGQVGLVFLELVEQLVALVVFVEGVEQSFVLVALFVSDVAHDECVVVEDAGVELRQVEVLVVQGRVEVNRVLDDQVVAEQQVLQVLDRGDLVELLVDLRQKQDRERDDDAEEDAVDEHQNHERHNDGVVQLQFRELRGRRRHDDRLLVVALFAFGLHFGVVAHALQREQVVRLFVQLLSVLEFDPRFEGVVFQVLDDFRGL